MFISGRLDEWVPVKNLSVKSDSRIARLGSRIALILLLGLLADLSFRFRPTNYFGGSTDD